jgi:hypothetical protein
MNDDDVVHNARCKMQNIENSFGVLLENPVFSVSKTTDPDGKWTVTSSGGGDIKVMGLGTRYVGGCPLLTLSMELDDAGLAVDSERELVALHFLRRLVDRGWPHFENDESIVDFIVGIATELSDGISFPEDAEPPPVIKDSLEESFRWECMTLIDMCKR